MPLVRLVALLVSFAALGTAQDPAGRELTVATKVAPPFVMQDEGGGWTGLGIELWRMVETRIDVTSRLVERDLETMLADTAAGTVDLAVGAITVTAEREAVLEFSQPFLSSGLGIATRGQSRSLFGAIVDRLISLELLQALMALTLVLAVCGLLVWLFERRKNPEQFGGKGLAGIGSGFWFSAVTMTTVGYGDKAPQTVGGRAVALVWMFTSIVIISSYTAAIASALTVESMVTVVRNRDDLPKVRIGTVRGSAAAQWLENERLRFADYDDVAPAMAALESGALDAVVYDAPILRSMTSEGGDVTVLPDVLRRENYAFAMPLRSPLRKPVNRALLEVLESPEWIALRERHLGR